MTLGTTTLAYAEHFCLAFGTKKLNFLAEARRNSLLLDAPQREQSEDDDLLSPIDIEWSLLPEIVVSSLVPIAADITDVESSGSSVCTASTDIFDEYDGHHDSSHDTFNLETSRTKYLSTLEGEKNGDDDVSTLHRFKPFHEEKWSIRYRELQIFHREHGHAAVPHTYPKNQQLARWIKR
jgi:hypothetical protein